MGEVGKLTTAERSKAKRLETKFNQTLEEHNAKREEQRNACAICRRPFSQYNAYQDHDHECCNPRKKDWLNRFCGKCNRGLLCFLCNRHYVPAIEEMMKDHVDPADVLKYIIHWQNEIKLKGGYAPKEKPKSKAKGKGKSQRKQKGVRRSNELPATTGTTIDSTKPRSQSRQGGQWRITKPSKALDGRVQGRRVLGDPRRVSFRHRSAKVLSRVSSVRQ